jgi:hypothetical protein
LFEGDLPYDRKEAPSEEDSGRLIAAVVKLCWRYRSGANQAAKM